MEPSRGVAGRRRAPRFPADLPCRILAADGSAVAGALLDLSSAGAAVTLPAAVPGQGPCRLAIETPDGAWRAEVPARLVTVDPDPLGGVIVRLTFEPAGDVRALAPLLAALRRRFNARQARIASERLGPYSRPPRDAAG